MAVLNRDDWYDIARDVEWTLSYVKEEDAFPAEWQGAAGIPRGAWAARDELYRAGEHALRELHAHAGLDAGHSGEHR